MWPIGLRGWRQMIGQKTGMVEGVGVGFQCTDRVSAGVDEGTGKNEVLGVA